MFHFIHIITRGRVLRWWEGRTDVGQLALEFEEVLDRKLGKRVGSKKHA